MNRRFIRAVAYAATVGPALLVVSRLVDNLAHPDRIRSYSDDPVLIIVAGIIVGYPIAIVGVVSVIVPMIRICLRKGYTDLGVIAGGGGIIGAILLPSVLVLLATGRLPSNYPILLALMALLGGGIGAGTITAYWLALDPPSYYRAA